MSQTRHPFKSSSISSRRIIGLLVIVIALAATIQPNTASAQNAAPNPISNAASKLNPMNWKMPTFPKTRLRLPNFLVPKTDQERIVQRKNGLMDDMKATTAASWKRTKEVLNPARLNPMNLLAGPSKSPSEPKSPGFFSSLFGAPASPQASQPEERVATVNQFLSQQRP